MPKPRGKKGVPVVRAAPPARAKPSPKRPADAPPGGGHAKAAKKRKPAGPRDGGDGSAPSQHQHTGPRDGILRAASVIDRQASRRELREQPLRRPVGVAAKRATMQRTSAPTLHARSHVRQKAKGHPLSLLPSLPLLPPSPPPPPPPVRT